MAGVSMEVGGPIWVTLGCFCHVLRWFRFVPDHRDLWPLRLACLAYYL